MISIPPREKKGLEEPTLDRGHLPRHRLQGRQARVHLHGSAAHQDPPGDGGALHLRAAVEEPDQEALDKLQEEGAVSEEFLIERKNREE